MQNTASEKTIRLSLSFRAQIGSPALPYEAQRIARELDIDLGEKISCSTYDCAVTPDFWATSSLSTGAGFASFT